MLLRLLIATCAVVLSSAESESLHWLPQSDPSTELEDAWGAFKINYGHNSASSSEIQLQKINIGKAFEDENEEIARKEIFAENLKAMNENNDLYSKGLKTFTMGVNQFADMNQSEFMNTMTGYIPPEDLSGVSTLPPDDGNLTCPKSVDWRKKGYVTRVKTRADADPVGLSALVNFGNPFYGGISSQNLSKLQSTLIAAARLIDSLPSFAQTYVFVRETLHWLPAPQRIQFNASNSYAQLFGRVSSVYTWIPLLPGHSNLRSAVRGLPAVSHMRSMRSFASWNNLPQTGALEGQHFRKTGNLTSLSEQQLVDCSKNNRGCKGGWPSRAFKYIVKNRGIDTEEYYPYKGKNGRCLFSRSYIGARCRRYEEYRYLPECQLKTKVATVGPLSVAIDAGQKSFQFYENGVYYEPKCKKAVGRLNHAVLVVGYGSDGGKDYWIVKNSWGTDWGNAGYIRMSRNRRNNCGIASAVSYPVV